MLNWGTKVMGTDQPRTLIHQWNLVTGAASVLALLHLQLLTNSNIVPRRDVRASGSQLT